MSHFPEGTLLLPGEAEPTREQWGNLLSADEVNDEAVIDLIHQANTRRERAAWKWYQAQKETGND